MAPTHFRGFVLSGDVDHVEEFFVQEDVGWVGVVPRQQPGIGDIGVECEVVRGWGLHWGGRAWVRGLSPEI